MPKKSVSIICFCPFIKRVEKGFGTVKVNESYRLIKKIVDKSAANPIVVGWTMTKWNEVKSDLIEMWKITSAINQGVKIT